MSNISNAVPSGEAFALGSYHSANLTGSKQTAFVQRDAAQFSATVPGPPEITATGETLLEATTRLEARVNLYA